MRTTAEQRAEWLATETVGLPGYRPRREDVVNLLADFAELEAVLRSDGANRYWEGRWRDEAARIAELEAEVARLTGKLIDQRAFADIGKGGFEEDNYE